MAEHDFVIDNDSASAARADINSALLAIVSNNSKATAPTTTFAYHVVERYHGQYPKNAKFHEQRMDKYWHFESLAEYIHLHQCGCKYKYAPKHRNGYSISGSIVDWVGL
jgi:hypothetical protein